MAGRPDRSDQHLPPEEAARVEAEVRGYFSRAVPKRPSKPPRSDPDSDVPLPPLHASSDDPDPIPELDKLRHLEADPQKLACDGTEVAEEYVETEYYDDLNCVDKEHHTTGTGFIKVEKQNGTLFDVGAVSCSSTWHVCYKSNPATNDWIPSGEMVIPISRKPSRSDN